MAYGPSQAMDYELEIGVVVGTPVPANRGLDATDADEHIFGLVLLNDWSGEPPPPFRRYPEEREN